ncbi:non-canonical purine NTP pyrophosphatase [Patescibacteria group bacterium]|nr:non-canonical purine NTP pyrophosphatase [Patescibacteria group bacterium]
MPKLLIATHNPAKFNEFAELLKDYSFDLVSLKDMAITDKAPEDSKTFEANALSKAKFYYQLSGLPTLADDSGLEIDVLGGWPGVSSRRIFENSNKEATDDELISETLRRLQGVSWNKRTCHFAIATALVIKANQVHIAVAQGMTGYIAEATCSKRIVGYPFRSLFFVSKYNKMSAELSYQELAEAGFRHRPEIIKQLDSYLSQI